MAKFLIVEDEEHIRKQWVEYLQNDPNEKHEFVDVEDIFDALDAVEISEEESEPFDLILLDHRLGDKTGLDLLDELQAEYGSDYTNHRVVVMTGQTEVWLAVQYTERGAIGHIIKPVSREQFWVSIHSALARQEIYSRQEDWETAIKLLNDGGFLRAIDEVEAESKQIREEYEVLKATYDQLLDDLYHAQGNERQIIEKYNQAINVLNTDQRISIESIEKFLKHFEYTSALWKDVEDIFSYNRVQFFLLCDYLYRIGTNPASQRSKTIVGVPGCREFRVGRDYRLYFRKNQDRICLERFTSKKEQDLTIEYLRAKYA